MKKDDSMIKNIVIILCTLATLAAIWILEGTILPHFVSEAVDMEQVAALFSIQSGFVPERVEKIQYFSCMILAPCILLLYYFMMRKISFAAKVSGRMQEIFLITVTIGFAWLTDTLFRQPTPYIESTNLYSKDMLFFFNPLLVIALFICICAVLYITMLQKNVNLRQKKAVSIVGCFVIGMVFIRYVFPLTGVWNHGIHFDAVFYSCAQVMNGKILLVDFMNQYGLYPIFLEPIFRLISFNVFTFTLLMAALMAVSYFCFLYFLRKAKVNNIIAIIGILALFYVYVMQPRSFLSNDVYFQYFPLRLIIPAIYLALSAKYFEKPNRKLYYGILLILSFGILWNMDSGLIAYLTFLISLCYTELLRWNTECTSRDNLKTLIVACTKHILKAIGILFLAIAVLYLYYLLRFGEIPNLLGLVSFQKIFYGFGYYMLNMPTLHPWILVLSIFVMGLAKGIHCIFTKTDRYHSTIIFSLSILGFGLFSYYQGRSHDYTFYAILYLPLLLLILFANQLYEKVRVMVLEKRYSIGTILMFLMTFFILFSAAITVFRPTALEGYLAGIKDHWIPNAEGYSSVAKRINFINKNTKEGEEVFIVSPHQGVLYAYSGTCNPINTPGNVETIAKVYIDNQNYYLSEEAPIGFKYFLFAESGIDAEQRTILDTLYQQVAYDEGSQLLLYEKIE